MATLPPRELKIGKIIDKTLGVIEHAAMPALIYVVGLTVVSGAITYFLADPTSPARSAQLGLLQLAIGLVFAYLLVDAALQSTGLRSRKEAQVFLPFVGLWILTLLTVIGGLILLVIPALIFMARLSIAQPLLVGRGAGVTEAYGESWALTKGNEIQIIAAALALLLGPIVLAIASGILVDRESVIGVLIAQLASSVGSLVMTSLGVALYGMIAGGANPAGGNEARADA